MKQTKRSLALFGFFDRDGIEAWLERQAEKGWLLERVSELFWHFRRIEPKKLHFSLVYDPNGSVFDARPTAAQLEFQDFCAHTGWKLAAFNAQMQIYYNESAAPTPIETDELLELPAIRTSIRKHYLPMFSIFAFDAIFFCALFFFRLSYDPLAVLTNTSYLLFGLCAMLMLVGSAVDLISFLCWRRQAGRAIGQGGALPKTRRVFPCRYAILLLLLLCSVFMLASFAEQLHLKTGIRFAILSFVGMLGGAGCIVLTFELIKRRRLSRRKNRILAISLVLLYSVGFAAFLIGMIFHQLPSGRLPSTPAETYEYRGHSFAVYRDEIPLTIEDLMDPGYDLYSYELHYNEASVLLEFLQAEQSPRWDALAEPALSYSVTTVKLPLLYDWCRDLNLADLSTLTGHIRVSYEDDPPDRFVQVDPGPWQANEAYQRMFDDEPDSWFVLCYDARIVRIIFDGDDWTLNDAQKRLVGETLGK